MIQIRRVYTPLPGKGGAMARVLQQVRDATAEAGFPRLELYRQALGPHGTMVTVQRWESLADYDASRERVRRTQAITRLFEQIYPLLAATHVTELYEEVS